MQLQNFSKIKLNILWKILCKGKCKVWLALPIETANQKIIQIKKPKGVKEIKKKLYHYLYFETNKERSIKCNMVIKLNKIKKYKGKAHSRFLKDNRFLQINKIKPLALKLKTPRKFYRWIIKNIRFPKDLSKYEENLNWIDTAFNVLKNKEGECGGKSLLFIALCRSIGIPARLVSGYLLKSGKARLFRAKPEDDLELHHWAEFYGGQHWIPVDCSFAQEEGKEYFGKFYEHRITVSKDMGFRLVKNGTIPFLQIGDIKPKDLNNIFIKAKIKKLKNRGILDKIEDLDYIVGKFP